MKKIFVLLFVCVAHNYATAQLKLPSLIGDSMILQRNTSVPVWGSASPGEQVQVQFNKKRYRTKTNADGQWKIQLPPTQAGGPYSILVQAGKEKIIINEILFGDVWFCSGQSNMVHQLNIHDVTYAQEIATANYPSIRQFWIPTATNLQGPQQETPTSSWQAAIGEAKRPFSAVAYFFAKEIHLTKNIPVGIINASVGGTPIEAWISEEGLNTFTDLQTTVEKNKDTAYINNLRRPGTNRSFSPPQDQGLTSSPKWFESNYQPINWKTIYVPGYWEDQGIKELNGIVWYRKEIDIPSSMNQQSARLFLGRIVDADEVYINGTKIGQTTYMYPQRRYDVPANLLRAGKNTIVVRVTNNNGKGGFVPDKPYYLFSGKDTVSLFGPWQYKVGSVFPPMRPNGMGGGINAQNQPAALYNAMVAPETSYPITGVCWYQGESNIGRADQYKRLMAALVNDWRTKWKQPKLPFLWVQLPGFLDYNYLPAESQWAALREAQASALTIPNTAMAVAIDLGEWNDIHPDNKKDVGERLALAARKLVYNDTVVASGPIVQQVTVANNRIIIEFASVGSGLVSSDGQPLQEFAIAGADKKFTWAYAVIDGNKVIVEHPSVAQPKFVRYAWADNPVNPNLFNKEGLPASPFRTDSD